MRKIIWGKTFVRAFKKASRKNPALKLELEKTLRQLVENPFDVQLSTHKLKGKLSGSWACSLGYDQRLLFDFVESDTGEDDILLITIGTHDEVY